MNNRGLNEIVTTVLVILIIVTALGVVGIYVKKLVVDASSGLETTAFTTNIDIVQGSVKVNDVLKYVTFNLRRGMGEGNLVALIIGFQGANGQSGTVRYDFTNEKFNEGEIKEIVVNYSSFNNIDNLVSLSIVPVVATASGQELKGKLPASYRINSASGDTNSGMVAYWDFEGTSDTEKLKDKSNNENDATIKPGVGAVSFIKESTGTGNRNSNIASFSGSGYLQVEDKSSLNFDTNSFTIAFWGRPESTSTMQYILEKKSKNPPVKDYNLIYDMAQNRIYVGVKDETKEIYPNYEAKLNAWRMYIIVIDREAKKIRVYETNDGGTKEPTEMTPVGSPDISNLGSLLNNGNFNIGADSSGKNLFTGKLDDIMVFNRALSEKEIRMLYTLTKK